MSVTVEQPAALALEPRMRPESNLWRDAARRFRKNKLAVGALVDDVDRDFVRAGVPEERDLESILVPIGELFESYV